MLFRLSSLSATAPDFSQFDWYKFGGKRKVLIENRTHEASIEENDVWGAKPTTRGKYTILHKDDPSVKFVFVNAWESAKDVKKDVAEFIKKGAYPFDVLFDLDNKVIESYKVNGIPTKFIVDPKGNIRFTSIGYSGSPDKLVEELSVMIDLARSK